MNRCVVLAQIGLLAARVVVSAQNTYPWQQSGNVGIGTTSPGTLLDVQGGSLRVGSTQTPEAIGLGGEQLVYFNSDIPIVTSGAIIGGLGFYGLGVSHGQFDYRAGKGFELLDVSADSPSPTHAANAYAPLYLSSMLASGNVGIGTTNPLAKLHADVGNGSSTNIAGLIYGSTQAGTFTAPAGNTVNAATLIVGSNWNTSNSSGAGLLNVYNATGSILWVGNSGDIGVGRANPGRPLDVSGTIRTSATGSDTGGVIYPDGSQQTTAWTGVLCGGDYAEDMRASGGKDKYEPGDVLVLAPGDNSDIQRSVEPYSTMVAGIYATKPGVVGRREALANSANDVPMAMVGVVPTKVTTENGPIHKGDLLVTSSQEGYAMKGTDRSRMLGAVIGKAMGSLDSGTGRIEVLVTLQ